MIYMVEIDFTDADHFDEWNRWYHGNLPLILTVPGFETAQRLEAVAGRGPRFLAIYTISSQTVFESDAYHAVGGGGTASSKWKDYIRRRRNLYSGVEVVPEISRRALLGVIDRDPAELDLPDLLFVPLAAKALARSPETRYLTVLNDASRVGEYSNAVPDLVFYGPMGDRQVSDRHLRQVASAHHGVMSDKSVR